MDKIAKILMDEFQLKEFQVTNTLKLIDEGNTIPFIAPTAIRRICAGSRRNMSLVIIFAFAFWSIFLLFFSFCIPLTLIVLENTFKDNP